MKINGVFSSFLNEVGTGNRFRYSTYMSHCKGARTSGLPQTEEVTSKPLCRHWASKHRCTGYLVRSFRLILVDALLVFYVIIASIAEPAFFVE